MRKKMARGGEMRRAIRRAGLLAALLMLIPIAGRAQDAVRTIEIHAKRYSFTPSEITIKKGEQVKLLLTSSDTAHSLVIKGLNVNAAIRKGHTTEVLLTPQEAGDFPGRCGHFCGVGHGSMTFIVHVTEK